MNKEKSSKLYSIIDKLSTVKLRTDPVEYGLDDLNSKIAEIDNKKNLASKIANKVIKMLGSKKRLYETAKDYFEIKIDQLLNENEKVAGGGSKDERLSIAKSILFKERKLLINLRNEVSELEDLYKCVNNCLNLLKASKEAISRQLTVINHQINLNEIDGSDFAMTRMEKRHVKKNRLG